MSLPFNHLPLAITIFKGQDACAGDSGGPFVLIKGENISKDIFYSVTFPKNKPKIDPGSFCEQSYAHFWDK